jgi:hypothetical protein
VQNHIAGFEHKLVMLLLQAVLNSLRCCAITARNHYNATTYNSWHLETDSQTLMSGGNGWLKRQFTREEPHKCEANNDGTTSLVRVRDAKVIASLLFQVLEH